ncbi:MAG: PIG-L family deacetylase [Acidobacteriaceae bacterium]|nr:PIG-L family deacetylase [Acidobacteriaceae bacterium]
MRIACIHAHPDDAEILAGGTLALLAALGHEVTMVTMTAGDCGSVKVGPDAISAIRKAEAAASAASIGAHYRCAGFWDLAIFTDDSSRRIVTGLLRDLRPQIVITASPSDYLCDHETTSELVRDACFAASVPNYSTKPKRGALPAILPLYFVDPIGLTDREGRETVPDFVVNVGSTLETKKAMLATHRSQREWLREQHGMDDYLAQMEEWTRQRGTRAGIEYGEGFRQYKTHPFPHEPVLQQILAAHIAGRPI